MARIGGSDELYRLIHSLTVEEKGYFVKFAKRQISEGNRYLQLFRLINRQQSFDEKQLKKLFPRYAAMKVYLKEIITDSLLLYYRSHHPHISLFSQIQKIHVLIVKGMNAEALKLVNKTLAQSTKMELFNQSRYLLQLQFELSKHRFATTDEHRAAVDSYKANTEKIMAADENLMQFEFLNEKWALAFSDYDYNPGHDFLDSEAKQIQSQTTLSLRAQVKKTSAVNWLLMLENNAGPLLDASQQLVKLERQLKKSNDSAFNTVRSSAQYILNSIVAKRFQQVEKLVKEMIASEATVKFYHDFAFIRGNLYLYETYFRTGQIQKGMAEMLKNDPAMLLALKRTGDVRKLRYYITQKIMFLFALKKFSECWLEIHKNLGTLRLNKQYIPSLAFLQMMIQFELGNFTLLADMAAKAGKKLLQRKMMNPFYAELLSFFKTVSPRDVTSHSLKTFERLKAKPQEYALLFNTLKYELWLQTIFSNKSLTDIIKAENL